MRAWVDLANSPHVAVMAPVVDELEARGWETLLTARDHAQTLALALGRWPRTVVVGTESPRGRFRKGASVVARARSLRALARASRPDVALSHGSYAQVLAARTLGLPAVTMMDYEFQPANHASFRLAQRVIVPRVFPSASLRRFGAPPRKVVRYDGYKEELYLAGFEPDPRVLDGLGIEPEHVVAVLRPPPEGALYHASANPRFEKILDAVIGRADVRAVLLPRTGDQMERYCAMEGVIVPSQTLDGPSLLAAADLIIGAGGTMNRESALLGTPTYTIFAGQLSAVDAALIHDGLMVDLRADGGLPPLVKKATGATRSARAPHGPAILEIVVQTVADLAREQSPAAA